jgi:hypothetical protein
MAFDVTTRSITSLTGGGKTIGGVASNNKAVVVGDIDITSYTAAGEVISAQDLGLTTLDVLLVSVVDVDGSAPAATQICEANYDRTTDKLLLSDGTVNADPNTSGQVRFVAFGETASAPDLV